MNTDTENKKVRLKSMAKKAVTITLVLSMAGNLTGCFKSKEKDSEQQTKKIESTTKENETVTSIEQDNDVALVQRPTFLNKDVVERSRSIIPSVTPYSVKADLSNISNVDQFILEDEMYKKLADNLFVVSDSGYDEFFEIYEMNRYRMIPNFVTVDSMMHTYHLYFSHLLKKTEKGYLADQLKSISNSLLEESKKQYNLLKGTEFEDAAKRNVAFFTIGSSLQDQNINVEDYVKDVVETELKNINEQSGVLQSALSEGYEDYTQYKPRGYYEGDEKLEKYFKAMMWYGRFSFSQKEEDLSKSAILITKALDSTCVKEWEEVYAITSFFAGASDDLGYYEYVNLMNEIYGKECEIIDFAKDEDKWELFKQKISELDPPKINSIPVNEDEDSVVKGFRVMGQRFSVDASVFTNLIYGAVRENEAGERRMLPDALDVPAALGSDTALDILKENGADKYKNYSENMEKLRTELSEENEESKNLFTGSLYANWLNTLRPLLTVKGEGWPSFMCNKEWAKKDLETFAGSFTELKHDTVLYSKQAMSEMGGGDMEEIDDRGYVQPEPLVFERFAHLSEATVSGLKGYGMLSKEDEESLNKLGIIANQLLDISEKELKEETLTDEEYDFIRCIGGNLEHFWNEVAIAQTGNEAIEAKEFPSALVTDIATDPNGAFLEIGTGKIGQVFVVVPVDGQLKIARGSVYSFYQFERDMNEGRLTDNEWRQMMGMEINEDGYYDDSKAVDKPEWTGSYRVD